MIKVSILKTKFLVSVLLLKYNSLNKLFWFVQIHSPKGQNLTQDDYWYKVKFMDPILKYNNYHNVLKSFVSPMSATHLANHTKVIITVV